MRIAIVAPGGVGGFFGAMLARAGEDVVALARGRQLTAIAGAGLRVDGSHGEFCVRITASDDAAGLGTADIVLFAVKLFQAHDAARAAAPLFGPHTLGVSLLNGIEGPDILGGALPGATILAGCAYVSAVIAEPGRIRTTGPMSSIVLGAPPAGTAAHATLQDFVARCQRAGFEAAMTDDVDSALWTKFVGLSTHAALTTASRLPSGPLFTDPDVLDVAAALLAEAAAVGRARGVRLPDNLQADWLARLRGFPAGLYASMYYDIAAGKPIEVDGLSGYIVREGRRLGVPTPHHAALYAVLKPHVKGAMPTQTPATGPARR